MQGIRLSHGAVFVTDGRLTVRLLPSGECTLSPITYQTLEWDLRCEPPDRWDYLSEHEILALPDNAGDRILALLSEERRTLGISDM